MNENMETRTFLGSVEKRANDGNKITITGMPIVFNAKTDIGGWWEESIDPGADESLWSEHSADVCAVEPS